MSWPFKRRKSRKLPESRNPADVPLYYNQFEEAVTFILKRASRLAIDRQPDDEEFGVELEKRLRGDFTRAEIGTAVALRAYEEGVCMRYVVDWTFYFTKVDPNRT